MVKGTPSMGKKSGKITHIHCRRCGQKTYHRNKQKCSSCGYGTSPKLRSYSWKKAGK